MKRIEPLKLRETDTEERYKINEIIEMLNQRAYIKVLKCNEAVEPKVPQVDELTAFTLEHNRYKEALEKIVSETGFPNKYYPANIANVYDIAKSALNPTPPDKACPSCGGKLKTEVFGKIIRTNCGLCPYETTENKVGKVDKTCEKLSNILWNYHAEQNASKKLHNKYDKKSEENAINLILKWLIDKTAEVYREQYPQYDNPKESQIAVINYIKDLRKALEAIGE